jgi:hypothetical protein
MSDGFRGTIDIDIRDSVPDWKPYVQPVAPDGAPNVSGEHYIDLQLEALAMMKRE